MRSSTFVCTLLGALLVIACERSGVAEVSPDEAVVASARARAPEPTTQAEAQAPAPYLGPIELQPVALRDGPLDLYAVGGRAYLLMDGEPIALRPGEPPTRAPGLGDGLLPRESFFEQPSFEIVDFAGDPAVSGSAHLVLAEHYGRAGSSYMNYRFADGRWRRIQGKHEMLREHYGELAALPDGTVIGLRTYNLDAGDIDEELYFDDESDEAMAYWREIEQAMAAAPRDLVVLAGELGAAPKLPSDWNPIGLAADTRGDLYAAVTATGTRDDDKMSLLRWAPGSSTPTTLSLPGLAQGSWVDGADIWSGGERVFVSGFEQDGGDDEPDAPPRIYLAASEGDGLKRIPVELPGLEDPWDMILSSVTQTDAGELWLTTGELELSDDYKPRLWRQGDGDWEPVALEPVASAGDAAPRWVRDPLVNAWVQIGAVKPRTRDSEAIAAVWAEGTMWVLADAGPAFRVSTGELAAPERRMVLYASRPAGLTELPSYDRVLIERVNFQARASGLEPGQRGCTSFSIVLIDALDSSNTDEADALIARHRDRGGYFKVDDGYSNSLFVGRLGDAGDEQLILEATGHDPKAARAIRAEIDRQLGTKAPADCQARELVEMVYE